MLLIFGFEVWFSFVGKVVRGWFWVVFECVVFFYSYKIGNWFGFLDFKKYFFEFGLNIDYWKFGDSL